MKPLFSKTIRINRNGRITIPKKIRDLYNLPEKVSLEIRLLSNNTIELIPEAPYREKFLEKNKGSTPQRGGIGLTPIRG
jgi:AbrB family looped-hinge helix DNA binding protein